jgi:hypothetical protein
MGHLSKKIVSLEFFNPFRHFNDGNAALNSPLSITYIKNDKYDCSIDVTIDNKKVSLSSIDDVSIHTTKTGYYQFRAGAVKTWNRPNLSSLALGGNVKPEALQGKHFFVKLAGIAGHTMTIGKKKPESLTLDTFFLKDFFTFFGKNDKVMNQADYKNTAKGWTLPFETEEQAKSCMSYLRTNFARACLSLFKYNLNIYNDQMSTVPLVEFDRDWTDSKLCEYFNLTSEQMEFVNSFPAYY